MLINDYRWYDIPEFPRPEKGAPYTDEVFGTEVMRFTDGPQDYINIDETNHPYIFNTRYATWRGENCDGSLLMLSSAWLGTGWAVFDTATLQLVSFIPRPVAGSSQPIEARWDANDPDILYASRWSFFYRVNVRTGAYEQIFDFRTVFPDCYWASVTDKGGPSADGRYWMFYCANSDPNRRPAQIGSGYCLFDLETRQVIHTYPASEYVPPFVPASRYCSVSKDGGYGWIAPNHGIMRSDFTDIYQPGTAFHCDDGISQEGRPVLVTYANARYVQGSRHVGSWMVMIDMETHEHFWLAPMGAALFHFNTEFDGWVLVSTYTPREYADEQRGVESVWTWGSHQLYLVELTTRLDPPPAIVRVCHSHSRVGGYGDELHAKISADGRKCWFNSGWHVSRSEMEDMNPAHQMNVYQVNLPDRWWEFDRSAYPIIGHPNEQYMDILWTPEEARFGPIQRDPIALGDYRGMAVSDARSQLRQDGFIGTTDVWYPNDTIPEGEVHGQQYEPGTMLGEGSSVALYVSMGQQETEPVPEPPDGDTGEGNMITVPNVLGMLRDEAVAQMQSMGFLCYTQNISSSDYSLGTIGSQEPVAGTDIAEGGRVTLGVVRTVVEPPQPDPDPDPEPEPEPDPEPADLEARVTALEADMVNLKADNLDTRIGQLESDIERLKEWFNGPFN